MNLRATLIAGAMLAGSALCLAAPSQKLAKGISDDDKKFVTDAASGGMAEVKLGQYAADNASNAEVKKFGKQMVSDHTKANKQLQGLAKEKGIDVPEMMSTEDQALVDKLTMLKGDDFDKAYVTAMVSDHEKDVSDFQKEADNGSDPQLKAWAGKTLKVLQMHLQHAQKVDKDLKAAK